MEVYLDVSPEESPELQALTMAIAQYFQRDVKLIEDGGGTVASASALSDRRTPLEQMDAASDRERELIDQIEDILEGGPDRGHEKLTKLGKLFVRDRLDRMFDEILYEDGTFARWDADERLPGDAIITGAGRIGGRKAYFAANDYTVKAGTIAEQSIEKVLRVQEDAIESEAPIIYLIDSSGGRIDVQSSYYADRYHGGRMFYNQCIMSGRVPQIAILYGPDFAGTAYQPVFSDYLVMVEGISAMAIASPRIVEMVTGEETSIEELGGPKIHAEHTGSVDLIVESEDKAVDAVHDLLGYLPQSYSDTPPATTGTPPRENPSQADAVIPENPNKPYDVRALIDHLVDEESYFELKPDFAPEMVTALARIDGRSIGIVANQPAVKTGAIHPESSEKAAGFIWTCDSFNIPLLYLCDTPGFMVGKNVERSGILQKGRKMVYATSCATVPKISVIVRKAYGAGTYAMASPAFDTDSVLALPSSQIAVMGPKAAVNAVYRNQINDIEDPQEREAFIREKREEYRSDIDIRKLSSDMVVDELIPTRDLRAELRNRFQMHQDKQKHRPARKHGTVLF